MKSVYTAPNGRASLVTTAIQGHKINRHYELISIRFKDSDALLVALQRVIRDADKENIDITMSLIALQTSKTKAIIIIAESLGFIQHDKSIWQRKSKRYQTWLINLLK